MEPVVKYTILSMNPINDQVRVDIAIFHTNRWHSIGVILISHSEWDIFQQTLEPDQVLVIDKLVSVPA